MSNLNLTQIKNKINQAYFEFELGRKLKHENIVEYKYFIHKYDEAKGKFECHTILEMLTGKDMNQYIRSCPPDKRGVDVLKQTR